MTGGHAGSTKEFDAPSAPGTVTILASELPLSSACDCPPSTADPST
jgi:hypothetical protein